MALGYFPLFYYFYEEGGTNHAEISAFRYSRGTHCIDPFSALSVWDDRMNDKVTEKLLGVLLAAVSAALCAAIDCLLKKEV